MKITKNLFIKCGECCNEVEVYKEDLEHNVYSSERRMGIETQHGFTGDYICNNCSNEISLIISVYEYPIGIKNYEEHTINGGSIITEIYIDTDNHEDNGLMDNI